MSEFCSELIYHWPLYIFCHLFLVYVFIIHYIIFLIWYKGKYKGEDTCMNTVTGYEYCYWTALRGPAPGSPPSWLVNALAAKQKHLKCVLLFVL